MTSIISLIVSRHYVRLSPSLPFSLPVFRDTLPADM